MNRTIKKVFKLVIEHFEYDYDLPHPLQGVFTVVGEYNFDENSVDIDGIYIENKCVMDSFDLDWIADEYIRKEYEE